MLLLEKLSPQEALKIFEIDEIPSFPELSSLYKKLVKMNHPDLGGSSEKMALINSAMDILEPLAKLGKTFKVERETPESRYDRYVTIFNLMDEMFRKNFDPEKLLNYLSQFTDKELFIDVEYPTLKSFKSKYYYSYDDYNTTVQVSTESKDLVFYLEYQILPITQRQGSLGSDEDDFNPYDVLYRTDIVTNILFENRKYKIGSKDWKFSVGAKTIIDFSEIFPPAKLKKILSVTSETKRSFKKRDMELGLARLLPGDHSTDKDTYFVYPFGKDAKFYIPITRITMLKKATWTFRNIQAINPDTGKYYFPSPSIGKSISLPETETILGIIVEFFNTLVDYVDSKHLNPVADSPQIIKEAQRLYKEMFESLNMEDLWKEAF